MNQKVPEPSPWMEIAAELRRIADDAEKLADQPAPGHFELNIQPWSADDYRGNTPKNRPATTASVDAVAVALIGKAARTDKISDGSFFHKASGRRGRVGFSIYQSVADPALVDKDEEIVRLRSRIAELESDRTGLAYSRADDEPDDPTPVSGARVPMHNGGMTDEGLVDETREIRPLDTERFGTPGMVTCSYCIDRVLDTDWLAHARTHDPQYGVDRDGED